MPCAARPALQPADHASARLGPGSAHRGQRLVLLLQLVVGRGERLLRRVQLVVGLLQLLLQGAQLLLGLQGVSYRSD